MQASTALAIVALAILPATALAQAPAPDEGAGADKIQEIEALANSARAKPNTKTVLNGYCGQLYVLNFHVDETKTIHRFSPKRMEATDGVLSCADHSKCVETKQYYRKELVSEDTGSFAAFGASPRISAQMTAKLAELVEACR
jgi:hypothetical protein